MRLSGRLIAAMGVALITMAGCGEVTSCIMPTYPKPGGYVLGQIHSLNDSEVDAWMVQQYKLNQKLK